MRVDFYQLGPSGHDGVIGSIAGKLLDEEQRLLIVANDEALLARLDRLLWDEGAATFVPHGIAGGADDPRQPILLATTTDAPNLARNILIADGEWRDAALHFDRAFYLFDADTLEGARLAWKLLAGRDEVERHYWANQDGKWVEKG
ncbi:MAG: DNA polymerase III subunit chi [Sphingomonas bacterium]|nr:DNA polymerase III subunit chi [Sphingomonas bacterium]